MGSLSHCVGFLSFQRTLRKIKNPLNGLFCLGKLPSQILERIIEKNDIVLSVNKNIGTAGKNIQPLDHLIKTPKKSVIARSKKQSEYIQALKENNIIMALGPAGTGKSFLAVSVAITLLMEKKLKG
mgnify:CR=1 FL=1